MESEIPPHVGADAHIGPLKCCDFASDFHKTGQFRRVDRVVRPYGVKNETLYNNALLPPRGGVFILEGGSMWASTPTAQNGKRGDFSPDPHVLSNTLCRGGRPCPPSKFVEFSWLFVGADAHIGPLKCCEFALDFHKTGQFRRADRVVRPYGAKSKINTVSPENRHKTGASCGSMRRPQARFEAQPRNARLLAPRWASTPTLRNGKRGDFSPDPHVLSNTLCRGGRLCPPFKILRFRIGFP